MKKKIRTVAASAAALSVLCAALPVAMMLPAGAAASNASGDLNGDGNVTTADVKILEDALLGNLTLTAAQAKEADVTGDNKINGLDLTRLRQLAGDTDPVSDAIVIHLSDSGITVEGDDKGVTSISGKTITISASGTYTVDGSITDGQILVNVADTTADAESVDLFLQDVTMESTTGAPCIYAQSAKKVKLTCGGTNTLTDTATTANAETSGVIYGECDLTITKNSTGTLNITSSQNVGIYSKDDIKLNGGTINIDTDVDDTSDADGIKAKNTVEIDGATVTVDSSADGIKSTKDDVTVTSGSVSVKAGNDAIQAATDINVAGGTVVACGDRGFTLDEGGKLSITGGDVLATATDYAFGSGTTVDTSGTTQTIMQLSYAAEWKKGNAITVQKSGSTVLEMTPTKKFDYVLLSGSKLSSSDTYQVYTGGTQMTHDGSTTGEFKMTSANTSFTGVTELSGGSTVTPSETVSTDVATALVFNGSSVTAKNADGATLTNPTNVTISGATATITASSEISVSGESTQGQVVVDVDKTAEPEGTVTLTLEGLTLSNSSVAPIYVASIGDEATISVKNGTTNTISDGTSHSDTYTDSDGNTETINGAIFSRDDLKIKGKGTLTVNGNTEDGIVCKDDLKLWNGTINVTAVDDGIRGNDSVRIGDSDSTDYSNLNITVKSGGDGIKTNNETDSGKGYITVNGGTIDLNVTYDGFQAAQDLTINDGTITVYTYEGSTYTASGSSSSQGGYGGMGGGGMSSSDGNQNKTENSAKGIKAGGAIQILGGNITVDSSDDSIHCAGDLSLFGGTLKLASADDGCHSDSLLTIGNSSADTFDDVRVYISYCYEGMEGKSVVQNSGTVVVNSADDGYNASGGKDSSGSGGNTGWNQGGGWSSSSSDIYININGGLALVNAEDGDHDGFDSNGSMTISGGYAISNGTDTFDTDGSLTRTGGVFVAEGDVNMTTTVSAYGSASAGTRITLADASGNVIVSFIADKSVSSLNAGCDDSGAVFYTGGTISGGTLLTEGFGSQSCYVNGTITDGTQLSSSSSGMGGNSGNQGGMGGNSGNQGGMGGRG